MTRRASEVLGSLGGAPVHWAAALALLVGLPAGAAGQKPVPTEIEIVPSIVAVAADGKVPTTFVLEARLWAGAPGHRASILESVGVRPAWSLGAHPSGVHLSSSSGGYHATVRIDPGTALNGPVTVQASAGGVGAQTQVVPGADPAEDQIEGSYRDASAPVAVVVRGLRTAADNPCAVWIAPAFVRHGKEGQVTAECGGGDPPWGIAVLDVGHAMEMFQPQWSSGLEQVSATGPGPVRTIPLALKVILGGGMGLAARQTDAVTFTTNEINYANAVLLANRAGVEVGTPYLQVVSASGEVNVPTCPVGDALTSAYDDVPPPAPGTPPMLHIYVVDRMGGADALTCAATKQRPFPVIYVRSPNTSGTVLLHELGHALGLVNPRAGHSDFMKGFDPANVMASGYADGDDVWRERITAGQVVRMNADLGSWLNWGKAENGAMLRALTEPRLSCQCGYDDPAGQCPRLVDDIARERGGLLRLQPWDCTDRIQLPAPELGVGEEPVALVAGRRWRSLTTDCRQDIPGHRLTHDKADFIEFDNLTRSNGCPSSWVAIFFRHQAPIFRDLTLMPGSWSDAAELRVLDRPIAAPSAITVHVHYRPVDEKAVTQALGQVIQVYGQGNRVGVAFNLVRHKSLPPMCPADAPAATPPVFHVCWSSATGAPTVAQLLGIKWGIQMLAPAQANVSGSPFADNAMAPAPGTGANLTLGQVFRIHATLGDAGFPSCATPSAPACPPLDADVKP